MVLEEEEEGRKLGGRKEGEREGEEDGGSRNRRGNKSAK